MEQARPMAIPPILRAALRPVLDYVLPPRCPGCGVIVDDLGLLCTDCWSSVDFIGEPLCAICGIDIPFSAGEGAQCGACIAQPPPFDRARAVMRYGETGRTIAHRLKYGRRVSLADVMANHMVRLLRAEGREDMILVPVPLHRWRIWSRGFNQSALIARQMGRRTGLPIEVDLIRRTKSTPPLHALRRSERAKIVKGAFALGLGSEAKLRGKTVILVDDIWTTGATASACARVLRKGGAGEVHIICWARVSISDD